MLHWLLLLPLWMPLPLWVATWVFTSPLLLLVSVAACVLSHHQRATSAGLQMEFV
jgi:hypothetical protein